MNNENKNSDKIETNSAIAQDEITIELEPFTEEAQDTMQEAHVEEVTPQEDDINAIISVLQAEISNLRGLLEEQSQKAEQYKKQYLTIAADFENFRKRTEKEKEEQEIRGKRQTIVELLSVVDNFERARVQIKPDTDGETAIHKSYQGVYKNLVDGLKKLGVSAMRPEGEIFNPQYHEAMLRESTDEHPEGTVIEQLVRGYTLNDQVLRHAMVKVAAPLEIPTHPQEENQT